MLSLRDSAHSICSTAAHAAISDTSAAASSRYTGEMRLFVDIGSEDGLMPGVYDLFGALLSQTTPIAELQAHVWPGGHQWRYWSTHAADYLRFYAGN
jgi:enterochelin esterase-like enzyme